MSRLKEILQIATANSEDAFDDLADLMSPEKFTKEELSSNMEEALGYDPIIMIRNSWRNTSTNFWIIQTFHPQINFQ